VLFAFDLDKTLVTNDYRLPDHGRRRRALAARRGHLVTVLTGRPLASARRFLEALEVDGPFSVNHGAQVMGPGGRELRRTRLRAADVRLLLDPWHAAPAGRVQLRHRRPPPRQGPRRRALALGAHREPRRHRFDPALRPDADKVVFASSTTARDLRARGGELPHVERYLWGDGFLEVIGAGADKGTALAFIAEHLGYAAARGGPSATA
jgi:HAD superfamily hydrolase (TIGR01484 family)